MNVCATNAAPEYSCKAGLATPAVKPQFNENSD